MGWALMALSSRAWGVAAGLLAFPGPLLAQGVVVKDAYVLGFTLPTIEFIGAAQTAAEIDVAFGGPQDTAAFLAIKADKIVIPDVLLPSGDEGMQARPVVKNLIAEGYDKGRISVLSSEKISSGGMEGAADIWSIASTRFYTIDMTALLRHASSTDLSLASIYESNTSTVEPLVDKSLFNGIRIAMPTVTMPDLGRSDEVLMESVEVNTSDYVGTFPRKTNIQIKGASIAFAQGPLLPEDAFLMLPYDVALTLLYDDKAQQMAIAPLTITTPKLGTVSASVTLNKVGLPALQGSEAEMVSSWLGIGVAETSLSIEDKGISEAVFAVLGESKSKTAAEARSEGIEIVRAVLPNLLSDASNAGAIVESLAAFLKDGGKIKLEAKPKQGTLGAADFIALEGPADLLPKLNFVVSNP
jgi:hypothetical protein